MGRLLPSLAKGLTLGVMALLALRLAQPYQTEALRVDRPVDKVALYMSDKRPFSWYYPEKYQYYYPRQNEPRCYWVYTNGTYVYTCS